jgi:hypothetical protein
VITGKTYDLSRQDIVLPGLSSIVVKLSKWYIYSHHK